MLRPIWSNFKFTVVLSFFLGIELLKFILFKKKPIPVSRTEDDYDIIFTEQDLIEMIEEYRSTHDDVPTHFYSSPDVFASLVKNLHSSYSLYNSFLDNHGYPSYAYRYGYIVIRVELVPASEGPNFKIMGLSDAYEKFLIEKHILGIN